MMSKEFSFICRRKYTCFLLLQKGRTRTNGLKLEGSRLGLDIMKYFLMPRAVDQWKKLPHKEVHSSSLEIFKLCMTSEMPSDYEFMKQIRGKGKALVKCSLLLCLPFVQLENIVIFSPLYLRIGCSEDNHGLV